MLINDQVLIFIISCSIILKMKGASSSFLKPSFEIESLDKNGRPSFRHIMDFNNLDEIYDSN
jgi:hypothetical protein